MQMLDWDTWQSVRSDAFQKVHEMVRLGDFHRSHKTLSELLLHCPSRRFYEVHAENFDTSAKAFEKWLCAASERISACGEYAALLVTLERGTADHFEWLCSSRPLTRPELGNAEATLSELNANAAGLQTWPVQGGGHDRHGEMPKLKLSGFDGFKRATNGLNPINQHEDLIAQDLARLHVAVCFHEMASHAAQACKNGPLWLIVQDRSAEWFPVAVYEVEYCSQATGAKAGLFGKLLGGNWRAAG